MLNGTGKGRDLSIAVKTPKPVMRCKILQKTVERYILGKSDVPLHIKSCLFFFPLALCFLLTKLQSAHGGKKPHN